ncbi:Ribosome maturation factor RimP [Legionella quinlivanii]|uniref:Ribosome maturation factor RimP n=1 Tax=Legionella quinlivanii TaxID=45073 RepID=A0A0W0Y679_9GAMM|nr:ribosome maturation factor RimP [Legionella quinlivanii]KTD52330.1 Ribosome maturation factor RimP [Legionella quinlivanii]MCW8449678.1 ribosome maturation factor RimP [Legionella quinlivanii]SEF72390.1 ribosome maturation factor RimP [Legionella quinlivanii DSM 21216]STY12171.1 NusA-like protein [Legionella quinlivanii]
MIKNDIENLLYPIVTALGYQLWACEYLPQGKHSLLRVYIDRPEGIGLGDCEIVSKQISALLDVEDPIPGNYSLEISSPGIPRPLFYREHYVMYIGQEIQLKLRRAINGQRKKLKGSIESVQEHSLVLNVENEHLEIPFSDIIKANLTGE